MKARIKSGWETFWKEEGEHLNIDIHVHESLCDGGIVDVLWRETDGTGTTWAGVRGVDGHTASIDTRLLEIIDDEL